MSITFRKVLGESDWKLVGVLGMILLVITAFFESQTLRILWLLSSGLLLSYSLHRKDMVNSAANIIIIIINMIKILW